MNKMGCYLCGKKSSVVVAIVKNDKIKIMNLCENCLKNLNIENISKRKGNAGGNVCPECGYSFEDFKETGFLGCPFCYEYFSPEIKEYLSKIHYSFVYKGKFPKRFSNSKEKRRIKKFAGMRNSIIEEIKEK